MVGTIAPVVYRNSSLSWRKAATVYTLGSISGGALTGVTVGFLGSFLPASSYHSYVPLFIGLVAISYSLHEMHIVALPHPEWRRQVPAHWRYRFHPYITAGAFGLLLGAGFTTFISTTSYYVVWLTVSLYGSPALGAFLFAIYGAARASLLWPLSKWAATFDLMPRLSQYVDLTKPMMRQVNGFALAMFGAYSIFVYLSPPR